MEHIAAFLLMVSCPGGPATCQEIPAPAVAYETVQACEADRDHALREPDTKGTCISVDPALFYEDAELVWDVSDQGELFAEIVTYDNSYTVSQLRTEDGAAQ